MGNSGSMTWWQRLLGKGPGGNGHRRVTDNPRVTPPAKKTAPVAAASTEPPHPNALAYRHAGAILALLPDDAGQRLAIGGSGPVDREQRKHRIFKERYQVVMPSDIVVVDRYDALTAAEPNDEHERVLRGHTGPIHRMAWEGDTVWSCGADRMVRRADATTGNALLAHQLHHDIVLCVLPGLAPEPAAQESTEQDETDQFGRHFKASAKADTARIEAAAPAPLDASAQEHADWNESAAGTCAVPDKPKGADADAMWTMGASVASDRMLLTWRRATGRIIQRESLSTAMLLDAIAWRQDDGRVVVIASDQLCRVTGRVMEPDKPGVWRDVAAITLDEPIYRILRGHDGSLWVGHRLGLVLRLAFDGHALKEIERHQPFSGCRVLSLHEFDQGGTRWIVAGSLKGDVAAWPVTDPSAMRHLPQPLSDRATAFAWWQGRLLAADYSGRLYDLTNWLRS